MTCFLLLAALFICGKGAWAAGEQYSVRNIAELEAAYRQLANSFQQNLSPLANGSCLNSQRDGGSAVKTFRNALASQSSLTTGVPAIVTGLEQNISVGMSGQGEQNRSFEQVQQGAAERKAMIFAAKAKLASAEQLQKSISKVIRGLKAIHVSNHECVRKVASIDSSILVLSHRLKGVVGGMQETLSQMHSSLTAYQATLGKRHENGVSVSENRAAANRAPASNETLSVGRTQLHPGNDITGLKVEQDKRALTQEKMKKKY